MAVRIVAVWLCAVALAAGWARADQPREGGAGSETPTASADGSTDEPADGSAATDALHPTKEGSAAEPGHGDGHAAHDPHDLTHANASAALSSPIEWRFDQALATGLVFAVLLLILAKLAWRPIMNGLDTREASIHKMIEDARLSAEAATQRLKDYEARLAAAAAESRTILAQAQQEAEKSSAKIIADAKQVAQQERARAVADIEAAKSSALDSIAERSVDLAVMLAGRIVGKQLSSTDHVQLIQDALEKFPSQN
jgi:F-type H+-transporting ATPase subunit b